MNNAKPPTKAVRNLARKHNRLVLANQDWCEILQMLFEDPWFRNRLMATARRVTRRDPKSFPGSEDVQQEALLQMMQTIKRDPSLGFNFGTGNYGAFMNRVILRACQNGRRLFRDSQLDAAKLGAVKLDPSHRSIDDRSEVDERLDLRELISRIQEPDRSVLVRAMEGDSPDDIARSEQKSKRTISRWINRAIEQIKRLDNDSNQKVNWGMVRSHKSKYETKTKGESRRKKK